MPADAQFLSTGLIFLPPGTGLPRPIYQAFQISPAAGITALSSADFEQALPAALGFWRKFGREYLTQLCQNPESGVPRPTDDQLGAILVAAPPATGMENLTTERLGELWAEIGAYIDSEAKNTNGGLETWLQERNPLWRLVGRVTFHLAENPANTEFPFAFIATYTHKLSEQSNLQHLPLGKAIRQFSKQKDARVLQSLLAPVQAAAEANPFLRDLLDSKRVFQALAWKPDDAHAYLEAVPAIEQAGIIAKVPDWWQNGRPSKPQVNVNLDSENDTKLGIGSLLNFRVELAMDGQPITEEEWEKLLNATSKLVSIRGQWVEVDPEKLSQALEQWRRIEHFAASGGITFFEGMRLLSRIGGKRQWSVDGVGEALDEHHEWTQINADGKLKQALHRLREPGKIPEIEPSRKLKATLRPYQRTGFSWLAFMHQLGLGACLADDMGLGKTMQVIALLLHLKEQSDAPRSGDFQSPPKTAKSVATKSHHYDASAESSPHLPPPSLLVVPASLIGNWKAEIEKFAPSLSIFYAHASQTPREKLERTANFEPFDAVITTYGMLKRQSSKMVGQTWNLVILDEAQAIKNPTSGQTVAVKALKSRTRLAMTGTPIENNVTDLWSLFDFINPGLLGGATRFREAVSAMKTFEPLRKLVAPYILRRLKTDKSIIADLPEKTEVRTHCALTKSQAALYQTAVREMTSNLMGQGAEAIKRKGTILSFLMRFKQICDHPGLLTGSGNFEAEHSGKFQRLAEIAVEVAARGEKMLVFTQFREMTDALAEHLQPIFQRQGLILHGGTAVKRRQELVQEFQDAAGPPFFVISLKAGGTGLTLTAASHVVHFDRWWNPSIENQATDRAYRIGQKKAVLVHKFVCPGTIESRIDQLIREKADLAEQLIGEDETSARITEMSDEELLQLVALDLDSAVF